MVYRYKTIMVYFSKWQFTALSVPVGPQRVQVNPRPETSAAMGTGTPSNAIYIILLDERCVDERIFINIFILFFTF